MAVFCKPNLPQSRIRLAVSGTNDEVARALEQRGAVVLRVQSSLELPEPVRGHADMLCLSLGGGRVLTAQTELAQALRGFGLDAAPVEHPPAGEYPGDVALNCLLLGDVAVGRSASLAPELIQYINNNKIKMLDVKQGYARCSTAVVDERSVITADLGIANALEAHGFDVMRISPGGIRLDGYDTGFIGGCCGKISADKMLFCGRAESHPDGNRILGFLNRKGVAAECSGDHELLDFGGFISIL